MITSISKCIVCLKPIDTRLTCKEITNRVRCCSVKRFENKPQKQINHYEHNIQVLANQNNSMIRIDKDTFKKNEIYYRRSH